MGYPEAQYVVDELTTVLNGGLRQSIHTTWLLDYKISGDESYVFNNVDMLYELYKDSDISINDIWLFEEAANWCSINNYAGPFLAGASGLDDETKLKLRTLMTPDLVFTDEAVCTALFGNKNAVRAIAADQTMIDAIALSEVALRTLIVSDVAEPIYANNSTIINGVIAHPHLYNAYCSNPTTLGVAARHNEFMVYIAENSEYMTMLASNPVGLNNAIKGEDTRNTFAQSEHLQSVRSIIETTVANSEHFTKKLVIPQSSYTDNTMYVNGSVTGMSSAALSPDACLVFLHKIYTEHATNKSSVTGLLNADIVQGTSSGWTDVEYLFVGGLVTKPYGTSSSVDSHGVSCDVYVPN